MDLNYIVWGGRKKLKINNMPVSNKSYEEK